MEINTSTHINFLCENQINMSHFREIKTKCFRRQVVLDDLR
jgi:hypothetical protein